MTIRERQRWKNQIRSSAELSVGMIIAKVYKDRADVFKITALGVECKHGIGTYLECVNSYGNPDNQFYNDSNLLPYKHGSWNKSNYLRWATREEVLQFSQERHDEKVKLHAHNYGKTTAFQGHAGLHYRSFGAAEKAYPHADMYGPKLPKYHWAEAGECLINPERKEIKIVENKDICCINCAEGPINSCIPYGVTGCLDEPGRQTEKRGRHNNYYNNFKPKEKAMNKKYEIVEGKVLKLADLPNEASPEQYWNFCRWLEENNYEPHWNLLTPQVVVYAADKDDSCFIDFLVEEGLVKEIVEEEKYQLGQAFELDGSYWRICPCGGGTYGIISMDRNQYYSEPIKSIYRHEFTDKDFPQIKEKGFKKVNLEIKEIE